MSLQSFSTLSISDNIEESSWNIGPSLLIRSYFIEKNENLILSIFLR